MNAAGLVVLMIGLGLAGCSKVGRYAQVEDTISKFDQGVHTVNVSQMAFLHQVRPADCTRNFCQQAFQFATAQEDPATHRYPQVTLDLVPACTPQELTNDKRTF
jgi:hypothetical protein